MIFCEHMKMMMIKSRQQEDTHTMSTSNRSYYMIHFPILMMHEQNKK